VFLQDSDIPSHNFQVLVRIFLDEIFKF